MEIWFATGNQGKLTEFKNMLKELPLDVHSQSELGYFTAPPEDGDSFLDNARIKAKALNSVKPEAWVVADDSGLVVEGLGGLPGVHSARYAGAHASASENNAKLLKMMQLRSATQRKAHFHCCLVAYGPDGQEYICEGELHGEITKSAQGAGGFGYDPVFTPEGKEQTLAELPPGEKNAISHRGHALSKLIEILQKSL